MKIVNTATMSLSILLAITHPAAWRGMRKAHMTVREARKQRRRLEADAEEREDPEDGKRIMAFASQQDKAAEIVRAFVEGGALLVSFFAPMQWGKTGVMLDTIRQLLEDGRINFEHVNIVTGMSSCEWKAQTVARFKRFFPESAGVSGVNVWHMPDLRPGKEGWRKLKEMKDGLIIIDECQFGSLDEGPGVKRSVLTSALLDLNLLDETTLRDRNIRIIQTSATPDNVILSQTWSEPLHTKISVCASDYPSYTSIRDMAEAGRIRPARKLIQSGEIIPGVIDEIFTEILAQFSTPKYHILRLPSCSKGVKDLLISTMQRKWNLLQGCGGFCKHYLKGDTAALPDLSEEPAQHTLIIVKERWRAAQTLCDEHLGCLWERRNSTWGSDSAAVQGFPGRLCGHNRKCGPDAPIVYANVASCETFIKISESDWCYEQRGVSWRAGVRADIVDGGVKHLKKSMTWGHTSPMAASDAKTKPIKKPKTQKKQRKCGLCKCVGHNKRTCPQKIQRV